MAQKTVKNPTKSINLGDTVCLELSISQFRLVDAFFLDQ